VNYHQQYTAAGFAAAAIKKSPGFPSGNPGLFRLKMIAV
jgi:hypothetical protein